MKHIKKYESKWSLLGISNSKLRKIYSNSRVKANTILKNKHKKEYSKILKELMDKEYKIYSTGYELLPFDKQIKIREHLRRNEK